MSLGPAWRKGQVNHIGRYQRTFSAAIELDLNFLIHILGKIEDVLFLRLFLLLLLLLLGRTTLVLVLVLLMPASTSAAATATSKRSSFGHGLAECVCQKLGIDPK